MLKKGRTITFILAILMIVTSVSSYAAPMDSSSKLVFSGVTLQDAGNSTQAFLDFKVKNVQNQGVNFDLEYNADYVELSNATNNEAMAIDAQNPAGEHFALSYDAIKLNADIFSENVFMMMGSHTKSEGKYNNLHLDFIASPTSPVPDSEYIGTKVINTGEGTTESIRIIKANNREVKLGSISFRIKDPASFAQLTPEELQSVFRVKRSDAGASVFEISYVDLSSYPPIIFSDAESNLEYQFNVVNPISSVTLNVGDRTVSAAEIFGYGNSYMSGTEQDLIAYLNGNMQDITVKYANGTVVATTIQWGDWNQDFTYERVDQSSPVRTWYMQGGVYEIKQKFNDDFTVTAKLTVTPVNVIGYVTENNSLTYKPEDVPADQNGLSLPNTAKPIFDQVISNAAGYQIDLPEASDWQQTSPVLEADGSNSFFQKAVGKYVFSCEIPQENIYQVIPWATFNGEQTVSVDRNIFEQQMGRPMNVTAKTDDDGTMTITVDSVMDFDGVAGLATLPEGTDFLIRMPNGEVLSRDHFPGGGQGVFEVTLNQPEAGKATIVLKAEDITKPQQQALQQYINMGARLGDFSLAVTNDTIPAGQSDWVDFNSNARKNIYLNESGEAQTGNYTFDYSSNRASLFQYEEGMISPPTTVRLAGGDAVSTTYNGVDGTEPGVLDTITVKSWELVPDRCVAADGTEILTVYDLKAGDVAVFQGTLSDINDGMWGRVVNDNDVTVTLLVMVKEASLSADREKIEDIKDFVFDQRRVGYTANDLQTEEFIIKNIGKPGIIGLQVSLSPTVVQLDNPGENTDNKEYTAFTLLSQPDYQLAKDGETAFRISTKQGLPAGTYTATVTVGSSRTAVLDTFQISFTVTEKPLYEIEVQVTPTFPSGGTAALIGGRFYAQGDTVNIIAEVTDPDFTFGHWELLARENILPSAITFTPSDTETAVSFVMPDLSDPAVNPQQLEKITIMAVFVPGEGAALKIDSLRLFNPDDSENPLLDETFATKIFDPTEREYWAIAQSGVEKNRAEFYVRQDGSAPQMDISVSAVLNTVSGSGDTAVITPQTLTVSEIDSRGGYQIEEFPLEKAPLANELVITLTTEITEEDGSKREVSRSYKVTIYRKLAANEMMQFNYGNSPYGLIMRDSSVADDQKSLWKQKFDEGKSAAVKNAYNCFTDGYTPAGGKKDLLYRADAWGTSSTSINYDKDDTALFVYSGESFTDPGILGLTDSLGTSISLDESKVKRQFTVMTLSATPLSNLLSDFSTVTSKKVVPSGAMTNSIDDLNGLRIRPCIYTIDYTFEDYDGTVMTAQRPLIILSKRGDVNVDGTADSKDADLLSARYYSRLPYTIRGYEANGRLYQYRVCDVNTDRNINIADRNYIKKNTGSMVEFY